MMKNALKLLFTVELNLVAHPVGNATGNGPRLAVAIGES